MIEDTLLLYKAIIVSVVLLFISDNLGHIFNKLANRGPLRILLLMLVSYKCKYIAIVITGLTRQY